VLLVRSYRSDLEQVEGEGPDVRVVERFVVTD
jgi:hypothetical protein